MKLGIILISLIISTLLLAVPAFAVSTPTYPNCVNPQANPDVENNGIHGIVGNTNTFSGNDKVYKLSGNTTVEQCFCDNNGSGIQTNWLETTGLSQDDIKVLVSQGWVFVPDGSAWGLDPNPYLAQNLSYSCINGTNASGNVSAAGDGLSDGKSDGLSDGKSSSPSNSAGQVLGAFTDPGQVLGLAFTGNTQFITGLLIVGYFSLVAGFMLKKIK